MKAERIYTSRPARPARCRAEDFVMSFVNSVSKPSLFVRFKRSKGTSSIQLTASRYSSEILPLFTLPCINYIFNPWYRNGRFSNVGGKYTFPRIWRRTIECLIIFRILLGSKHCTCKYLRNINTGSNKRMTECNLQQVYQQEVAEKIPVLTSEGFLCPLDQVER